MPGPRGRADDLKSLKLRDDLPMHKAVQVALIEHGWRHWLKTILRALKNGAEPRGRMNRTAMNAFLKAVQDVGKLADAVAALLRELAVDSVEELKEIVDAYRQAQRAEPEDNLEVACLTIEAHLKEKPDDREQLLRRFGGVEKGESDA